MPSTGLLLTRVPDIIASAGALSEFGDANEIVRSLVKSRTKVSLRPTNLTLVLDTRFFTLHYFY
jgi:hypothetical protein